ncbi:MHYT domain-containing protein [Streptomyces sp. NPDC058739]|uniref:MHYT domain-containing protein n=1 Tax=Streptomyces sp. NPDC058739 TaxID=3346618 RepID=UPI003692F584
MDGFGYGTATPVTAFLTACLGGSLGLRCTARSLLDKRSWRGGWLTLGAASAGSAVWAAHIVVMLGFRVAETRVRYDVPLLLTALGVSVAVAGIGVFLVGYLGANTVTLSLAGITLGLGVVATHYLVLAALRIDGDVHRAPAGFALSVALAVVASTAALWVAVTVRGFRAALGASLVMGVAITGSYYAAMASVTIEVHGVPGGTWEGDSAAAQLFPTLLWPAVFLALASVIVLLDPLLVLGDGEWSRSVARHTPQPDRENPGSLFEPPARSGDGGPARHRAH